MNFRISTLFIAIASMLFVSCKDSGSNTTTDNLSQSSSKETLTIANPEKASFSIEGMTCEYGCARTIEKKVSKLEGVLKANVDFENKTATVEFDASRQSAEQISKFIESLADGKTYKVTDSKS